MKMLHVIASVAKQSSAGLPRRRCLLAMTMWLFASPALALTVDTPLPDSAQEARAEQLFTQIRCVVCAGEAIADSPAEVARDMRVLVRERITAGKSDDEILGELTAQYGERILMMPKRPLLWLAPLLLLLAGAWFAWRSVFAKGVRE